ncbi:hypothetical protein TNCV_3022241 [Trichonephila clavipes]|nr:hypothetical protein TNCV_3022241 [Trichonephila clavipes]
MHINHDSESNFEKNYEDQTVRVERKMFKCYQQNSIKKDIKPQVYHETQCAMSKRHKQEKVQNAICGSLRDNTTTITRTKYVSLT